MSGLSSLYSVVPQIALVWVYIHDFGVIEDFLPQSDDQTVLQVHGPSRIRSGRSSASPHRRPTDSPQYIIHSCSSQDASQEAPQRGAHGVSESRSAPESPETVSHRDTSSSRESSPLPIAEPPSGDNQHRDSSPIEGRRVAAPPRESSSEKSESPEIVTYSRGYVRNQESLARASSGPDRTPHFATGESDIKSQEIITRSNIDQRTELRTRSSRGSPTDPDHRPEFPSSQEDTAGFSCKNRSGAVMPESSDEGSLPSGSLSSSENSNSQCSGTSSDGDETPNPTGNHPVASPAESSGPPGVSDPNNPRG